MKDICKYMLCFSIPGKGSYPEPRMFWTILVWWWTEGVRKTRTFLTLRKVDLCCLRLWLTRLPPFAKIYLTSSTLLSRP